MGVEVFGHMGTAMAGERGTVDMKTPDRAAPFDEKVFHAELGAMTRDQLVELLVSLAWKIEQLYNQAQMLRPR
jgi:hypothetical protein